MIREVEVAPDGRVLVTIEEPVDDTSIPPCCAGCLGASTKLLGVAGVRLAFPYCDACAPQRLPSAQRLAAERAVMALVSAVAGLFRLWALMVIALCILAWLYKQRTGTAVTLTLSESGTVRLAFANAEYARRFVEANGGAPEGAVS